MRAIRSQLPNTLTLVRLFSLPVILFLTREERWRAAVIVYVLAALLDCADGWLARRWNVQSRFGLYLDPVVDKIVILSLFYELARIGLVPFHAAHALLVRELLHNAVRAIGSARGTVIGSNWMGKTKAALQNTLIVCGLAFPSVVPHVGPETTATLVNGLHLLAWFVVLLAWTFFAVFLLWNRGVVFAETGENENQP